MRRTSLALAAATAIAATTAPAATARAQSCKAPKVLLLVDKSSSMVASKIDGKTLWRLAKLALSSVTMEFDDELEFGLMVFPGGPSCTPPELNVAPALDTHDAIMEELGPPPPPPFTDGSQATPLHQSLSLAAQEPTLAPDATSRVVILITDGEQWCKPSDLTSDERFRPIESIEELNSQGIITYVVGFGKAYDAYVLNQMATVAGTARPGCNADGKNASADDSCFYKAENHDALLDALKSIATEISGEEACDGEDNDCDEIVDEDLELPCETDCGEGVQLCEDGEWTECSGGAPSEEVCDGQDNDCDDRVDEAESGEIDDVGGSICEGDGDPMADDDDAGDPSGCGCRQSGRSGLAGGLFLALCALIGFRRREAR